MNTEQNDALVDAYRTLLAKRIVDDGVYRGVAKTRGPRGDVGTGTPGRRLKRSRPDGMSLKAWARMVAANEKSPYRKDAAAWFASKRGR